ncbi:hypothetical protein CK203_107764 [Vitis vinifera]|uniref:Retrotransposon gag domain-containing protein n=1 Tax=Vitis vinifera TaxID=29760 RepID=A0A438CFH8_VITVI|nr:hypothetical protein CK203_107764 [Vitis vinifera]
MATNKERIEALETGLGGVQDGIQRLEDTVNRLSEILLSTRESSNNHNNGREGFVRPQREENDSGRQIFSSKMVKLEFPKYSRADPTEWCNRVAQFFEFQDTADNQKVSLASFHLEGEANQWWQWLRRVYQEEDRVVTWELFEEELWARFGPTECENFDEALSKIRQIGSLRDYQKEFERLGNRVHGWSQKALVGSFMGGLRSEISETIRMFKPKTLKEATSLARMKDEQLQRQRRISRPPLPIRTPLALPTTTKASPVKRLSWEEMQKRRAQGLCFNCDDKFTSGHRCKGPQLLLLEGNINDDSEGDTKEAETDLPSDPEISLHALTDWTATKTMRVTAKIGTHDVVVLIDSGSTHNFISDKVAALLHLPVVPTAPFHVRVANSQPLKCQGRFDNIHILLQGIPFSITFYSLPLNGLDLVLGVQWLEQLGSVVCDWKKMTMEFQWANKPRLLQGSRAQNLQQASLEAIAKDMRHTSFIFAICLQPPAVPHQTIPLDMQTLIEDFAAIFEEPQQLPPVREVDHCISLKEGTKPTNVPAKAPGTRMKYSLRVRTDHKEMPIEVTDSIVGVFFNGCKIHGRRDLAKLMAEDILRMELKRPGGFVTLSNIYTADGEWEEVENIRKVMKE